MEGSTIQFVAELDQRKGCCHIGIPRAQGLGLWEAQGRGQGARFRLTVPGPFREGKAKHGTPPDGPDLADGCWSTATTAGVRAAAGGLRMFRFFNYRPLYGWTLAEGGQWPLSDVIPQGILLVDIRSKPVVRERAPGTWKLSLDGCLYFTDR